MPQDTKSRACLYADQTIHGMSDIESFGQWGGTPVSCPSLNNPVVHTENQSSVKASPASIRRVISAKYGCGKKWWELKVYSGRNMSTIWKGIVNNLKQAGVAKWMNSEAFKWVVGDGNFVLFWEDVWCGDSSFRVKFARLYRLASNKGTLVADLAINDEFIIFNWQSWFTRELLKREMPLVKELHSKILNTKLIQGVQDRIIWIHEKSGLFTVKKLTNILLNSDVEWPDFNFGRLWRIKVPPKVRSFLWLVKIRRIPTTEFLKWRGVLLNEEQSRCCWCGVSLEDVNHFFCELFDYLSFLEDLMPLVGDYLQRDRIISSTILSSWMKFSGGSMVSIETSVCEAIFSGTVTLSSPGFTDLLVVLVALETFLEARFAENLCLELERPWNWWKIFAAIDSIGFKLKEIRYSLYHDSKNLTVLWLAKEGLRRQTMFKAWCREFFSLL
ncbi:hypothetical protein GQ457_06G015670 [Hibiscus cannabinus]